MTKRRVEEVAVANFISPHRNLSGRTEESNQNPQPGKQAFLAAKY